MAIIRVYYDEDDGKYFPDLCMRCGEPADRQVAHTFTWMPQWVYIIILAGLLPWLIVAMIMRKSMRITVPLCHRHAYHWLNRSLYVGVGLLVWIAAGTGVGVAYDDLPKDIATAAIALCIFGPLTWLFIGVLLAHNAIRANEITEQSN